MKKIISVLLAILMVFSLTVIAFAYGSREEEANCSDVRFYCEFCDSCSGKFGCKCCEKCPGHLDENAEPTNTGLYASCRYDSYLDSDEYDPISGDKVYEGDWFIHYYWKGMCCAECTGLKGCQCHNTTDKSCTCQCVACSYTPDEFAEAVKDGIEAGRQGYTSGIQTALAAIRDVMYDLFNQLFEFLRIDIVLPGREPTVGGK